MANLALITGASSGLGLELARIHAAHGGDLIITSRNESGLGTLKKELEHSYGIKVFVITQDLSTPESAQSLYLKIKALKLDVDILINNAGMGCCGPFSESALEEDLSLIYLNLVSLTTLTKLCLHDMRKRGGGHILNISSVGGDLPGPYMAIYYASKAYVTSFSKAVWQELKASDITMTVAMPGPLATNFTKASRLQGSKISKLFTAHPHKAATQCYRAMLQSKRAVYVGMPWWLETIIRLGKYVPDSLKLRIMDRLQHPKAIKKNA